MLWIALVVALGVLIGALIVTYGYRHSMLIGIAVLAALIAALVWYLRFGDPPGSELLSQDKLRLENMEMTAQYRNSYRMTGRLVNMSSDYALRRVTITITASDCTKGGDDCIVVGEAKRIFSVDIPPGQARDVVDQYVFPRFSLQGELQWRHDLSEIQAARP
ncbi:MAG: hypothetical protein U5R46_06870 [Gammaproteobacteria bacterium]|nr:hypothetical protein [Gammaproteobacteria bacterium]